MHLRLRRAASQGHLQPVSPSPRPPLSDGAWEESTEHARASPPGLWGVCSLPPSCGRGCNLRIPDEVLASSQSLMAELHFSNSFTGKQREICIPSPPEACFHTSFGSRLRQKVDDCCFRLLWPSTWATCAPLPFPHLPDIPGASPRGLQSMSENTSCVIWGTLLNLSVPRLPSVK